MPPLLPSSLLLPRLCLNRPPSWSYSTSIPIYLHDWQEPPGSSLAGTGSPHSTICGGGMRGVPPSAETSGLSLQLLFCSFHEGHSQPRVSTSSSTVNLVADVPFVYRGIRCISAPERGWRENPPGHRDEISTWDTAPQ